MKDIITLMAICRLTEYGFTGYEFCRASMLENLAEENILPGTILIPSLPGVCWMYLGNDVYIPLETPEVCPLSFDDISRFTWHLLVPLDGCCPSVCRVVSGTVTRIICSDGHEAYVIGPLDYGRNVAVLDKKVSDKVETVPLGRFLNQYVPRKKMFSSSLFERCGDPEIQMIFEKEVPDVEVVSQ